MTVVHYWLRKAEDVIEPPPPPPPPPPSNIALSGLIARYKFDEGSGTTLGDSSGAGNHGTLAGGSAAPSWAAAGLQFSGAQRVNLPSALWAAARTIQICCSFTPTSAYQALLAGDVQDWVALAPTDALIGLRLAPNSPFVATSRQIRGSHCVTLQWGSPCGLWLNGTEGPYNERSVYTPGTATLLSVGSHPSAIYGYTGTVYYMLVYDRVLTGSEVTGNFAYLQAALAGRSIALGANTLSTAKRTLVCDGDSLTAPGYGADGYPSQLLALLGSGWNVTNLGVGGRPTYVMADSPQNRVDPLLTPAGTGSPVLIVWGGTNDFNIGNSAAATYATLSSYCAARRTAGWKVIVATLTPSNLTPDFETKRQAYNTSIRSNWATFADALMDLGADSTIGAPGSQNNTTYYAGDATHLTAAGLAVVAGLAQTAIGSL